jgi:hypothetical protein
MSFVARFGERAVLTVLLPALGLLAAAPTAQAAGPEDMTFFLTSVGSGKIPLIKSAIDCRQSRVVIH